MVIFIDGARNVGKSYLISNIKKNINKYKFPFNKYYEDLSLQNNKNLFFLTLGYDLTLLDLVNDKTIVDRGILSDVIFGILSERITYDEGLFFLNYITNEFDFKIVYIISNHKPDTRGKDNWYYNKYLFDEYAFKLIKSMKNVIIFKNEFDNDSVFKFNTIINTL